jgi:hypothetical protein
LIKYGNSQFLWTWNFSFILNYCNFVYRSYCLKSRDLSLDLINLIRYTLKLVILCGGLNFSHQKYFVISEEYRWYMWCSGIKHIIFYHFDQIWKFAIYIYLELLFYFNYCNFVYRSYCLKSRVLSLDVINLIRYTLKLQNVHRSQILRPVSFSYFQRNMGNIFDVQV